MLVVKEVHISESEWTPQGGLKRDCVLGEPYFYETDYETPGVLFRVLQREHGQCTSKVYRDGPNGQAIPIGWYFHKRKKYDDCADTYLHGVWCTVHARMPVQRTFPLRTDTMQPLLAEGQHD